MRPLRLAVPTLALAAALTATVAAGAALHGAVGPDPSVQAIGHNPDDSAWGGNAVYHPAPPVSPRPTPTSAFPR